MGENGYSKILEVVKLFIENINENKKGVDGIQRKVDQLIKDLGRILFAAKIVLALFTVAILIGGTIFYIADKGWFSTPDPIVQPAIDIEKLKKELVEDILDAIKKEKECENEDTGTDESN